MNMNIIKYARKNSLLQTPEGREIFGALIEKLENEIMTATTYFSLTGDYEKNLVRVVDEFLCQYTEDELESLYEYFNGINHRVQEIICDYRHLRKEKKEKEEEEEEEVAA